MFKKLMAGLGIGTAKVNLVLDNDRCRTGEYLKGRVLVEGGKVDQEINSIDFDLVIKFRVKGQEFTKVAATIEVAKNFVIKAGDSQAIPFEHYLPLDYPISGGCVEYSLKTRMDIARAVDTGDSDRLTVLPSREMERIMQALASLGFREKIGSGKLGRYGQEFEYYPTTNFTDQLHELEIKFYSEGNNIKMFLELELNDFGHHCRKHYREVTVPPEVLTSESMEQTERYLRAVLESELSYAAQQGPSEMTADQYYHHHYHRGSSGHGFSGFMGGMVTGLLGATLLDSLFDDNDNQEADNDSEADGGENDGGLFDFDLGDLTDFGGFGDEDI